jgi:DNA invertase Pin-like site-specific DNA recombinase
MSVGVTHKPTFTCNSDQTAPAAAYLRVSTQRQGQSGLGLEAQRSAIIAQLGHSRFEEFVEVESGKKTKRPQLEAALAYCRKAKSQLVIAKLDRLARNVHFISGLMESGVDFVAADMPQADRFMLHIFAAMAEEEGRRISERTKAALAAAKARGIKLGKNGSVLAASNKAEADAFALSIAKELSELNLPAQASLREIADTLNDNGISTSKGGHWHPTSVSRLLKRLGRPQD